MCKRPSVPVLWKDIEGKMWGNDKTGRIAYPGAGNVHLLYCAKAGLHVRGTRRNNNPETCNYFETSLSVTKFISAFVRSDAGKMCGR